MAKDLAVVLPLQPRPKRAAAEIGHGDFAAVVKRLEKEKELKETVQRQWEEVELTRLHSNWVGHQGEGHPMPYPSQQGR